MDTLPPAVSRMNLEHLKTFHCVAQSGSFTRAARLLFLTQPAVSQQMQGLENALHVALFDRSRRSITLTAEGEVLYGYTRRLFGLFDEIGQVFQDLSLLQAGTLTLAASAVMGSYYLPPLLRRFHKRFPQIRFNIRIGNSGQVFDWVAGQEAELALPDAHAARRRWSRPCSIASLMWWSRRQARRCRSCTARCILTNFYRRAWLCARKARAPAPRLKNGYAGRAANVRRPRR